MIGVLGASGAVGRTAAARIAGYGLGPLRLGGRDLERARELCASLPDADTTAIRVDVTNPRGLSAFCDGCRIVVNCAGPSYRLLDTVARAAIAAGAHYVDAAGDAPALDALRTNRPRTDRVVVFSAGTTPGLTGLLPRILAAEGPLARLDSYVGGAAPMTPASTVDVLLTRGPRFGTPLAAWRDGQVTPRALHPLRSAALAGFPRAVHAWPFLTTEATHLAESLHLDELRHYSVYVSDNLPAALAAAWADDSRLPEEHAPAVAAAAAADIASCGGFYILLFMGYPRGGGRGRRLILRTPDPYALSGVVAAAAARDVAAGRITPGIHLAADVLDTATTLASLATDPVVASIELR